ncbi:MAG: hypothetical protein D6734_04180 [Candidatus Schekmanbacteria bacterium]|nr:MAG: hypothetical protein D6734_04180 [Candidatus Schekmanbacteria bacterium]
MFYSFICLVKRCEKHLPLVVILTALSPLLFYSSAHSASFRITFARFIFDSANDSFTLKGKLRIGKRDLTQSALTLDAGPYSETINAGFFKKTGKTYIYKSTLGSSGINKAVVNIKKKKFIISASGVDLSEMSSSSNIYIGIGDSFSKCASIKIKKTRKGSLWKLKGKSKKCKNSGKVVDAESGGTLKTKDGGVVSFPESFGTGNIYANFKKTKKADGEISDDMKTISGEYLLSITGAKRVDSNITVSIPIDKELLPDDFKEFGLQPEYYDASTKEWIPEGDLIAYDSAENKVTFNVSLDTLSQSQISSKMKGTRPSYRAEQGQFIRKYRVRVYIFSSQFTATLPGSNFSISYYPSYLGKKYSVMKDSLWKSSTGNASDSLVPDFVEDLDAALNSVYAKILTFKNSAGSSVFSPLSTPQDVFVTDCGTAAGESPLGGPLKISNSKIEGWADMKGVAAHELIHVFQNQYYTGGISGNVINYIFSNNRWFIEAVANYYAAKANGMSEEEKKNFIKKDGFNDYLNVPLTSTSDNSMYAAMHFLDWLSSQYSSTIVGDALAKGGISTDIVNLSKALEDKGVTGGIGEAYGKYLKYIISAPEDYSNFNNDIKNSMATHALSKGYLTDGGFTKKIFYISLKKPLKSLTAVYVQLKGNNPEDALLVIDSSQSKGSLLSSYTYDFIGEKNSDYSGKNPIDKYKMVPSTLTVKHFGKTSDKTEVEQLILNSSPSSGANADVSYYLLIPPEITKVKNGNVKWTFKGIGKEKRNIPREYISGFNVFREGIKLNGKKLIPMPKYGKEMGYSHSVIKSSDTIEVQIVDKYGNVWPEIITDTTDTYVTETLGPFSYSDTYYNNNFTANWTVTMKSPSKMKPTVEIKNEPGGGGTYPNISLSANVGQKIPIELTIDGTYNFEKGTEWTYDDIDYPTDIITATITNTISRIIPAAYNNKEVSSNGGKFHFVIDTSDYPYTGQYWGPEYISADLHWLMELKYYSVANKETPWAIDYNAGGFYIVNFDWLDTVH